MTQQEQQLLNGLIERVNNTQLQTKDDDAERLLQSSLGRNPDAIYILCQTVLVQQFALEKSGADLQAAREELEKAKQGSGEKHGSFLGNLLGLNKDEQPQQPQQNQNASTGYQPVQNAPAPPQQYGYPQQYPPQQYPPQYPPQGGYYQQAPPPGGGMSGGGGGLFGGGGGFLQGAAQTAAGVVAGEMAFRAIEDIFSSHHGDGRGFTGGNEVVNNYYDSDNSRDDNGSFGDRLASANNYDGGVSSDIEDRRGESSGFFDNNNDSANGFFDGGGADDASNFDDSSNFDDGGGSFDDN